MNWMNDWPIEPGYYWFYGWRFQDRDRLKELCYVKAYKIQNGISYVTCGHFLYKEEGAKGVWQLVNLPELPTE